MDKIRVDSRMRAAFIRAHNKAGYSPLKRKVARKLRTNRGVIFMRRVR
jgi:hypothetical protein